ncbi:SAM-dependent methyltransferase [Bacillus cereus]|nr:SAM-dependent methyltransferase [Bacillus cereus]
MKTTFGEEKIKFDSIYGSSKKLAKSLVPEDGKIKSDILLRGSNNEKLEDYYKWQFIYSLISSGLYQKDFIGTEVRFPKGTTGAAPLRIDAAIFDSVEWIDYYRDYWDNKTPASLQWLGDHLVAVIEFKRGSQEVQRALSNQIKPAMREKDPSDSFVLGMYYDEEKLYLFQRKDGKYLRYDESKNQKGDKSLTADLSLHISDPYYFIPSFTELMGKINLPSTTNWSDRNINDLEVITSISTVQIRDAMSKILRTFDKTGLVNQRGFEILIQTFALKIYDEKRNERTPANRLKFYITNIEKDFISLNEIGIQDFISRMKRLWEDSEVRYQTILQYCSIDWENIDHIRALVSICESFQDFSFARSSNSDLYQLIFYNFANTFKKDEQAQFLTPLPIIDFIVKIVNPRREERVIDPCCGIGDFLSLSFVNSQKPASNKLIDSNIYGVDRDRDMIMLSTLNMLLNGDGESKLLHSPDKGSILSKVGKNGQLVNLIPEIHKEGEWDNWRDNTKLMKFDVVLTNPPFGEDRAYVPETEYDKNVIEMYETWNMSSGGGIDLGIVFLENAYRILNEGGRMGIVLSNSIASVKKWEEVRKWFAERMRIVGLFDLPPNVFGETGVNTSIIIAYKPTKKELEKLNKDGYSVFVKDIENVGYEKRTSKRNVFFNPVFKIDPINFEIMIDKEGNPILEEDFTNTIIDFKAWANKQEKTLIDLFIS